MPLSHFPHGLSSFGIPLIGSGSLPTSEGTYWFVNGDNGSDGNTGLEPNVAFATIGQALSLAQSGDVILIMPATYDENLTITTDYIQLVGILIPGYARPDVTPTTGMAMNIQAQGFHASHIRFVGTGVGGIGVQQMGNGYLYDDCVFESSSNIGLRLFPNKDNDSFTASEGLVTNCLMRDCAGGGLAFENPGPGLAGGVGVTDVVIDNCRFYGNTIEDIMDVYTAGGNNQTFTKCIIRGCQFATKNKTTYIDLSAGTANAGLICDNYFADTAGLTAAEIVLGNDIVFAENFDAIGVVNGSAF